MGAKLQKINNKNTKFMRVGGGTGFISTEVYHRTNLFERYKKGVFKYPHCFSIIEFRIKVPVLSYKDISPC